MENSDTIGNDRIGNDRIMVGVIYGSTRPGRFCDKVGRWAAERLAAGGLFTVDVIDPAESDAGPLARRIAEADAFVVVTPEYNHGYPAPLKSLIDSVGAEWHAKPVAFVSYGGISGGLRAVEQLRLVFAELHAVTIRDSVSFAGPWEQFDGEGVLREPERAQRSMAVMLGRLYWWAVALRNARGAVPYTKAA
jgi:NAD(P)H-dependent FMN reductase